MAQTEHPPIYKTAYDFCLYIERVVENFPRSHKHSIGIDLKDSAREMLKLVVRANARRDNEEILGKLREEIKEMNVLLMLCHDLLAFPDFNSFEHAISLVTEIAKQNDDWLKTQRRLRQSRSGKMTSRSKFS